MRIAIDIRKIGKKSTGDETYTFNLVSELIKNKEAAKHRFFLLTDTDPKELKKSFSGLPKNFSIHKIAPTQKLFWTFYSLPKFLKSNPVDILHVQYIVPLTLPSEVKIVTTIHDVSFKVNPGWISKTDSLVLNLLIPRSLARANSVITVSNFSKREIIKYFECSSSKIFVTHPAVDLNMKSSLTKRAALSQIKNRYKFNSPYLLHISSLQPRKKVPLIIKAFDELKDKWKKKSSELSDIKLIVVGSRYGHNYDNKINEFVDKSKHKKDIIFTGYVPSELIPVLYKGASTFIFPSLYEGFGFPILEALINDTPVVASKLEVFQEVAGEAVLYIDINKNDEEKLTVLKEKIEKSLKKNAAVEKKLELCKREIAKFTWEKMAEKTLQVYYETKKRN